MRLNERVLDLLSSVQCLQCDQKLSKDDVLDKSQVQE